MLLPPIPLENQLPKLQKFNSNSSKIKLKNVTQNFSFMAHASFTCIPACLTLICDCSKLLLAKQTKYKLNWLRLTLLQNTCAWFLGFAYMKYTYILTMKSGWTLLLFYLLIHFVLSNVMRLDILLLNLVCIYIISLTRLYAVLNIVAYVFCQFMWFFF